MQNELYQIAALLIAVSIAITLLIFIIRTLFKFMSAKPEVVVLLSLIAIAVSSISLLVPEDPKIYENLLILASSTLVLLFAGGIYNRNRG